MDDQNDQTSKATERTRASKSTGASEPPKSAAPRGTSTRSKRAPQAESAATTESKPAPKSGEPAATVPKQAPTADATPTVRRRAADATEDGAPSRDEMSIAFTPGQMAVGGAIVAGLLVFGVRLLLGRRRGRG